MENGRVTKMKKDHFNLDFPVYVASVLAMFVQ